MDTQQLKNTIHQISICDDYRWRYANEDGFDSAYPTPKIPKETYRYKHVSIDCLSRLPYEATNLFLTYAAFATELLGRDAVKPGDLILRMLEYAKLEPFGTHTDISYLTIPVVTGAPTKYHYGTQANLLKGAEPEIHNFNGKGSKYSLVFFANAHYSTKCEQYGTIGGYLNSIYYSK